MKFLIILIVSMMGAVAWSADSKPMKPFQATPYLEDAPGADHGADTKTVWRFGIGLGIQPQMQDVEDIEVGTGEFLHCRNHGLSAILQYSGRDTIAEDASHERYSLGSYKLMLESKLHGNTGFVNTYFRLGVGYTSTDKVFDSKGGFWMMPLQLGADMKVMTTDWSYLAFFVQTGSEINFLGNNTPAKNFDGLSVTIGFRGYY